MKTKLTVAKNAGWLVSAKFIARILTAVFIILLANHLLPRSFGIFNFALALSYVGTVITDLGFDELTIREVSRDDSKGPMMLGNVLALRVLLAISTISILAITYFILFRETHTALSLPILIVASSMILMEKFSGAFVAQFQALQRMEFQALTTIISKSAYLILGISGILLGYDLLKILILLFVSYLLNLILSFYIYFTRLNGKIQRPKIEQWRPIIKEASPFTAFVFLSMVYGHIIILILSVLEGDFATGVYSASWKIIVFFGLVPYSFGRALYPVFSQHFGSSEKVMQKTYRHSLRYLLLFSLPLTLGLYVIGGDVLQFIYRSEFSPTISVFKTIIWLLPFLFMNGSLKMALWGSDRTIDSTKNLALASVVLVVVGLITIPQFGVIGAAIAVVLAEITHFITNYHVVTTYLGPIPFSNFWKPYAASMVMAGILYSSTFFDMGISSLWLLPPAMIVYFLVLYLMKGIGEHDINIIKELVIRG